MTDKPSQKNVNLNIRGDVSQGNIIVGDNNLVGFSAEQVQALLTQIRAEFQPKPFDGVCPYVGLNAFGEQDAERFFGREGAVEELLQRVESSQAVFITGPSGSGKSSLARAGLAAALKSGRLKGSDRWLYTSLMPGRAPLEALAAAVSRLKSPEVGEYLLRRAGKDPNALYKALDSALSDERGRRVVLLIDQFEELFTPTTNEKERQTFIGQLTAAAAHTDGRLLILVTMRSDFVAHCANYPALNDLLNRQFFQVGAMHPEELVRAVAMPAMQAGLPIEPELILQINDDLGGEPGALPLMQFALTDLFEYGQQQGKLTALTRRDYLARGGLHKSLERHAEAAFADLSQAEQELAETLFRSLVEIGRDGAQDTRRTARFEELIPLETGAAPVEGLVRKLADARLLITAEEEGGSRTVTLAHEKLIEAWPWLRKLVGENREAIALQNRIQADAAEWEAHGRDASYLYTGARLATAREKVKALALSKNALDFVKAGLQAAEEARRKRERTRRRITIGLVLGLAGLLMIAVFAGLQWRRAEQQAQLALARQLAPNRKPSNSILEITRSKAVYWRWRLPGAAQA